MNNPNYIIAIGASAGGMEEINIFFDHTPLDAVSYVIVQHLSPDFKSRMVELLSKHSKLLVKEAANEMTVNSNEVYLIPSDKLMTIRNGRLYLSSKEKNKGVQLTINRFLNSLAADVGTKAIGVILSGMGSDGTEGIIAIKEAGGMVMARNPETSEFPSMPSNAIATGMVDFILEPAQMPGMIESYANGDEKLAIHNREDEKYLSDIVNVVRDNSPFDFSEYKQPTILRRVKKRAAFHSMPRLVDYLGYIKATPGEVDTLAQDFLINVTSFFRDKEAFEFIGSTIMPEIISKLMPDEEIKIWVAGCATGEEAYSLAISLAEQLKDVVPSRVVKIFATDIDSEALAFAAKGVYNHNITGGVSDERLDNFFIREGVTFKVKPEIRNMVIFAQHDLVKNPPYCNMHLISCRNLLIYMAPPLQKKVLTQFLFGLKMDGYLFLGPSENPVTIAENLELVNKKWKIFRNRQQKKAVGFDAFAMPAMRHPAPIAEKFIPNDISVPHSALLEAINASLIDSTGSLILCIDENNTVVQTCGDSTKYLLQKNFTTNLSELLPDPLSIAFNTVSHAATKTGKKSSLDGIGILHGKTVINVCLDVIPLEIKKGGKQFLMVRITESVLPVATKKKKRLFTVHEQMDQYTKNLEVEVMELKDALKASYQQLDISNENMQAYNEEILSSNEEMQSTNEEMQSVNEELHTINAEYQLKNKELEEVNSDLDNYFRSNINGQLFVNTELVLMKFSPGTVKQINLLPSDIGRPLSNISTNIKFETLMEDIKEVLKKGDIISKEIETKNGLWYQVMTMPSLQQPDNKINGAIITFNDITALKRAQSDAERKNKILERINTDLDNFVLAASHDLLAPLSNIEMSIAVMNKLSAIGPELNEYLAVINHSVKKFRSLITDIGTVAKVENSMLLLETVEIEEVLENVLWSLDDTIRASKAIINRRLNIKRVLFSKNNLRSILFNLVSNSLKYRSEAKPEINIDTNWVKDHLVLSVEDNGVGIPKKDNTRIFAMYGRLQTDIPGQGIGLYLVQKIVDAAEGRIVVESEEGKGSKFSIHFKG